MNQESVSYFDSIAREYAAKYSEESPGGYALRVRKARVIELLDGVQGRVLDMGCGPGVMAEEILNLGCEFWGVDASPRVIAECRRKFGERKDAHFSVGDVTRLGFTDGSFDAVICIGVIDGLEARESALHEMVRVLRPGGVLVVSFPNLLSPYAAWKSFVFYPTVALLRPMYYAFARRPQPPTLYSSVAKFWSAHSLNTPRSAARLMARHSLAATDVAYFHFNLFLSPLDELFPGRALKLAERLERMRCGPFKWLGAGFVVRARKR